MQKYVCDNPQCGLHIPKVLSNSNFDRVVINDEIVVVERYIYRNNKGEADWFYLCEICHSAVQMVLKK